MDAQKGLISKKLPGCTNGIWTVKMFLGEGKYLPPFLIMKDDGEVWQLATGEASVCWKCGQSGHIGDKCRQAVNILAESLASPAVGVQPSWAHVVRGGVSLVVTPPPPPPCPKPQQLFNFKLSCVILRAGKASLKAVNEPIVRNFEKVGKVVSEYEKVVDDFDKTVENTPTHHVEAASMVVQLSFPDAVQDDAMTLCPSKKKAKLSSEVSLTRDPRLRGKVPSVQLATSPDLPHKVPAGGELRHGPVVGGGLQHGLLSEDVLQPRPVSEEKQQQGGTSREDCEGISEKKDDIGVKTNMFGFKYMMWFEIGIEGKDPMDQTEDDWGGKIEFGFSDKTFCKDIEDYFLLFEDECSLQSHTCAARVARVLEHVRDRVIGPPSYDPRNIVELLDKYGDAHISDSGWREIDEEEWFDQE